MSKKLILKKIFSEFIFRLDLFLRLDTANESLRVLNYHSITDEFIKDEFFQMTTPKNIFEGQMKFLFENGYSVISCDEAIDSLKENKKLPPKAVCITFDDGFKDNLTNAASILEKYGFKATIFLTVNFINSSNNWLNWEDITTLSNKGTFSFASHTLSHRKLYGLKPQELVQEIGLSKEILENYLKRPVDFFAYPFGSYGSFDERSIKMVKSKGYKAAFTTIAGRNTSTTDLYIIRRMRISWFDDEHEFVKELKGAYDWYRLCQRLIKTP